MVDTTVPLLASSPASAGPRQESRLFLKCAAIAVAVAWAIFGAVIIRYGSQKMDSMKWVSSCDYVSIDGEVVGPVDVGGANSCVVLKEGTEEVLRVELAPKYATGFPEGAKFDLKSNCFTDAKSGFHACPSDSSAGIVLAMVGGAIFAVAAAAAVIIAFE